MSFDPSKRPHCTFTVHEPKAIDFLVSQIRSVAHENGGKTFITHDGPVFTVYANSMFFATKGVNLLTQKISLFKREHKPFINPQNNQIDELRSEIEQLKKTVDSLTQQIKTISIQLPTVEWGSSKEEDEDDDTVSDHQA